MKRVPRLWLFFAIFLLSVSPMMGGVVANFSSNVNSGCSPLTVNFTDHSTGGPTSWHWTFGNTNNSNSQNPSAVYSLPGTYTATLVVTNGPSTDSMKEVITVYANPVAAFSNTSPTCVGQNITFTDHSVAGSGPISSWHWDFGDGSNANTANTANHIYSSPGNYPSSLIVTDTHGCSSSAVVSVVVNAIPVAAFSGTPLTSCTAPLLVTFTNTSTGGGATYSWNFGDGGSSVLTNPTHTYNAIGSYAVTLYVTQNGCVDSLRQPNYVIIQQLVADFKADTTRICLGQSISFTDLSVPSPSIWNWSFGDGTNSAIQNPAHIYLAVGTYTVSLAASDPGGCASNQVKNSYITVLPNPIAGFSNTATSSCSAPFSVTFTDTTVGAVSWAWSFGDGGTSNASNPSHTYLSNGNYSVKLVIKNANGCTDSIIKPNLINISPTPAFFIANPTLGCIPLTVNFMDTTTTGFVPAASYIWDFGNGTVVTTGVPTVSNTYTLTGVYTVKLTVITSTGCRDSSTLVVKTGTPPVANFTGAPTTICFGQSVSFTDLSTGGANQWLWTFGDGGTSTAQNPAHVFTDTGTFTIQLIAMFNGCPDTVKRINYIQVNPPIPKFTFTLSCVSNFTVQFTNTSIGADSVTWDFGDGTFDNTNNNSPTHIYLTRGTKTIILTAYNKVTGCSFSITHSLVVALPIAAFSSTPNPPNGCIPLAIVFPNTSQDGVQFLWNFGDGGTSTLASPPHTYLTKGTYTVSLTVTDTNGCTNTLTIPNYVHALGITTPNFTATPLTGCAPLFVTFQDSTVSDSTLVRWTWTFGDGTPPVVFGPTPVNPSHEYMLRGNYNVTLTVVDTDGCTATVTRLNYINPTKPYPSLNVDTFACKGNSLPFDASATTGTSPLTYSWDFGDGNTATTAASLTTHTYASDNVYTVTLTVSDPNGCDSVIKKTIRILQPVASFRDSVLSFGCGTEQVQFINQSTGFVNSWQWSFGNGATSTLQNPAYTYTSPGTYQVKLTVHNLGGCVDSIVKDSIVVVPGPLGTFTFAPKIGCVPLTVHFIALSGNATYFTWDFGDGTVISQSHFTSISHTYTHPLIVTPILLIGDTLPNHSICELPATNLTGTVTVTQSVNLTIIPGGPITISDDQLQPLNTVITSTTNNLTYSWGPSQGLNCTNCQDVLVSSTGQNMTYYFTVIDIGNGGCTNTDSIQIIYQNCDANPFIPNVFSPNGDGVNDVFYVDGICFKTTYRFTVYDRWGVEMFSTSTRREGWDGRTTSGENAQPGVYYYLVNADDKVFKGFIELIR